MRLTRLLSALLALQSVWACRTPAPVPPQRKAPARKSRPPAPAARKSAAVHISAENIQRVERLYSKAVRAYSENDLEASLTYLGAILAIDPSYAPALELRETIREVSTAR